MVYDYRMFHGVRSPFAIVIHLLKLHVSLDRVLRGNTYHVSRYRVPHWRRPHRQLHKLNKMLN
jgi:hypothetical protein